MSIRITKAMGYGLTLADFQALTPLKIDFRECLGDELDRLIVTPSPVKYGGSDTVWRVINKGMLTDKKPISDLIMEIGAYDTKSHVMFFPSEDLKNKWHRFNDDLDWYAATADRDDYPESSIRFVKAPLHPFKEIPDGLRWWLVHFGVLTDEGVNRLRPLLGEWWG